MLAYSSIAHAGYVLMGFADNTARGREAALFYLFAYTFMSIGAFAVITLATRQGDDSHSLDDYRGLALRRPVLGGFLIFFVLARAGIPLTGGFVAKLEIFSATARAEQHGLLIVGVLAAVVTAFFYLRIAMTLLSAPEGDAELPAEEPGRSLVRRRVDAWSAVVLVATGVMVLWIGVLPDTFIQWARDATFLL